MKSALTQISNCYSKLSYSERLFAEYVLSNRDQMIHMPIAQVSQNLGIASSTILAGIRKLGFEGYREFKIALASELLNPITTWSSPGSAPQSGESNISQQVVLSNIAALRESLDTMNYKGIRKGASLLLDAEHIYIFGVGTSSVLAREAHDFLFRLGLFSWFHEDLHYQQLIPARMQKQDIALLISQSGVNKDIINIAELLKNHGCRTIGISNYMGTPFGKYMDLLLAPLTMVSQIHDNNFSFRIPILCIIEALYYEISEQMGDHYHSVLKQNQQLVEKNSVSPASPGSSSEISAGNQKIP